MELPAKLKNLYKHWSQHTSNTLAGTSIFVDSSYESTVAAFIKERIHIWEKKERGMQPPYTTDPILQAYRFCNIFRELDRQTIHFHTKLLPLHNNFALWLLNMFYFRLVANTDTIDAVGLLSFDTTENKVFYEKLNSSLRPRYGTPYVFPVSTIMKSAYPTREKFLAFYLPQVMRQVADEILTWKKISVCDGMDKVLPLFGFDIKFLWNEVLIDVAYQYPEHIDLFKNFPVGPGALPTFAKINHEIPPHELARMLGEQNFVTDITYNGSPLRLSAENWEGVGCEFRKYTNLTAGKGRKRLFAHKNPKTSGLF